MKATTKKPKKCPVCRHWWAKHPDCDGDHYSCMQNVLRVLKMHKRRNEKLYDQLAAIRVVIGR